MEFKLRIDYDDGQWLLVDDGGTENISITQLNGGCWWIGFAQNFAPPCITIHTALSRSGECHVHVTCSDEDELKWFDFWISEGELSDNDGNNIRVNPEVAAKITERINKFFGE